MINSSKAIALITLCLTTSCGKAPPMPEFESENFTVVLPADGSNVEGAYIADFITLNTSVNGYLSVSSTIIKQENDFQAYVRLSGGAPSIWHKQDIYTGWRCPTEADDLNGDGLIDIVEGNKVWGEALIPLDSNLNSQDEGKYNYPVGDQEGGYYYKRSAKFSKLFDDLKTEDKDPDDNITKLSESEGMSIEGRVIVILGTQDSANLPETVATTENLGTTKSFPLACGLYRKINEIPSGETNRGDVSSPTMDRSAPSPAPRAPTTVNHETPRTRPRAESPTTRSDESEEDWTVRVRNWWRERWREINGDDAPPETT